MEQLLQAMTKDAGQSPYVQDPLTSQFLTRVDPWGNRYRIYQDLRGGEGGGTVVSLELTCAGPDGRFDTPDDIVRASKFIPLAPEGCITPDDMPTEGAGALAPRIEQDP